MVETRAQRTARETPKKGRAAPQSEPNSKANSSVVNGNIWGKSKYEGTATPNLAILGAVVIALISYFTFPESLQPVGRPTLQHVWYFGWISALSTGLGVLPCVFTNNFDSFWVGVSNCELMHNSASYNHDNLMLCKGLSIVNVGAPSHFTPLSFPVFQ